MKILAIDPGKSGGYAVFERHLGLGGKYVGTTRIAYGPMPPTDKDLLDILHREMPSLAVVEDLPLYTGNKKVPGSRMAVLHRNFGTILGMLLALNIPTRLVRPQEWQRGVGAGSSKSHPSKTAWKNHLKGIAQRLHPSINVTLATADALLILEWALRDSTRTS